MGNSTHYFYGSPKKIIPRPADCVETVIRHMRQSYSMAKEHIEWETIWISPNVLVNAREALERKFPRPNY